MKKMLLLFLLLTTGIFAQWEVIKIKDEFGDETGQFQMVNYTNKEKSTILISPPLKNLPSSILMSTNYYFGSESKNINFKLKNENNELLETKVFTHKNNIFLLKSVSPKEFNETINFFEKSKNIRIAIPTEEGKNILIEVDSSNFNEIFSLIKDKI